MSLVINTNVYSLNSQRALSGSGSALATSLQRLSSGLRINSARDDAAGLAVATRMTTRINGQQQAVRNANEGISMLQVADGSLSTLVDNLQRIRTLAVQSANASNSASDRQALDNEAQMRLAEVDRLGKSASFNGTKIFSQDATVVTADEDERDVVEALQMGWLQNAEDLIRQRYGLEGDGASINIDLTSFSDGAGGTLARVVTTGIDAQGRGTGVSLQVDMSDFTPPNLPNGGTAPMYADRVIAHEMTHAVMARNTNWNSLNTTSKWFLEGAAEFVHGADERVAADLYYAGGDAAALMSNLGEVTDSAGYSAGYVATRYLHQKLIDAGYDGGMQDFMTYLSTPVAGALPTMDQALDHFFGTGAGNAAYDQAAFVAEAKGAAGQAFLTAMDLGDADTGAIGGFDSDGGQVQTAENIISDTGTSYGNDVLQGFAEQWPADIGGGKPATRSVSLQIGSEVGQTVTAQFGAVNLAALGLSELNLNDAYASQRAIVRIDSALDYINGQRADIGSQLSRLDSVVANLQVSVETGSASRSRILDTDYAAETAELTRAQILQQAGTAMVAQANSIPQNVLSLLRG